MGEGSHRKDRAQLSVEILRAANCAALRMTELPAMMTDEVTKKAPEDRGLFSLKVSKNELRLGRVGGFAGLDVGRRGGAGGNGLHGFRAIAHQVRHERSNLKRHLLAFGHCAHRLALEKVKVVVPGVD